MNYSFIIRGLCLILMPLFLMGQTPKMSTELATFAGGCFWCMEPPLEALSGVLDVSPGYTGGKNENPTYKEVSSGKTGHIEAIQIIYDPKQVSYTTLLDTFWQQIDPTDPGGQFADRGSQYVTAIFYHNDTQKELAEQSKDTLEKSERFSDPIVTKIMKAASFYPAEDNHHDYYKKNPLHYNSYKKLSGRKSFIETVWEDDLKASGPDLSDLKK